MRVVAEAAVTVPAAPLFNVTTLLPATGSKPNPVMVNVVALAETSVVVAVTTGFTSATLTAVPLSTPAVATIAVSSPAFGLALSDTVNEVAVAFETVPTAPLLKVTVF